MGEFPDNKVTGYKNKLPRPLHLDGEWEVGLIEFTYPYSWFQITDETSKFSYKLSTDRQWTNVPLRPVRSLSTVQDVFNKNYIPNDEKQYLRIEKVNDNEQLRLSAAEGYKLRFEGKITQIGRAHV